MKTYTANQVAHWFLSKEIMSPNKLQKLVYYAYSWYLTVNNQSADHIDHLLFSESIKAWDCGPVVPCLYHDYKYHEIDPLDDQPSIAFDVEDLAVLNNVWDIYGHYPTDELEQLARSEMPWKEANKRRKQNNTKSEVIPPKGIYAYYVEQSLNDVPFNLLMIQINKSQDVFEWLKDK